MLVVSSYLSSFLVCSFCAVRSFGTEDRDVERKVAASSDVYEFIVFRGNDIKDLHVSEPPKQPAQASQPHLQDPAIVQVNTSPALGNFS